MAKLTFEDLSGSTPAMLWPEEFAKMADQVKNDAVVWVKGTVDRRRDPPELVISRIIPRESGPKELVRGVMVRLQKGFHEPGHLDRLLKAVRIRPGNLDLYFDVVGVEGVRRARYRAGVALRIRYDERLVSDLEGVLGAGYVRVVGPTGATARLDTAAWTSSDGLSRAADKVQQQLPANRGLDDSTSYDADDY